MKCRNYESVFFVKVKLIYPPTEHESGITKSKFYLNFSLETLADGRHSRYAGLVQKEPTELVLVTVDMCQW